MHLPRIIDHSLTLWRIVLAATLTAILVQAATRELVGWYFDGVAIVWP